MTLPKLISPHMTAPHGFYGRVGGVSAAPYDSLNTRLGSEDDALAVATNRQRIAQDLGAEHLLTARQVHGNVALLVDEPFADDDRPEADALVTTKPGIVVGVLTADCFPVLLDGGHVVGAAHAGWRGSLGGIIESTVALMEQQGVERSAIRAATGPALRRDYFEVRDDLIETVTSKYPDAERHFTRINNEQSLYDHHSFVMDRLIDAGIARENIHDTGGDTLAEQDRFFSYRGVLKAGHNHFGGNASAIALRG